MKICKKCDIEKPMTDFHPSKSHTDGYYGSCKACRNLRAKNLRDRNSPRFKTVEGGPIIIFKYKNRRLYDQSKSCYITHDDVVNYVLNDVNFQIFKKGDCGLIGHDITRYVLFEIVRDNRYISIEMLIELIKQQGKVDKSKMITMLGGFDVVYEARTV